MRDVNTRGQVVRNVTTMDGSLKEHTFRMGSTSDSNSPRRVVSAELRSMCLWTNSGLDAMVCALSARCEDYVVASLACLLPARLMIRTSCRHGCLGRSTSVLG